MTTTDKPTMREAIASMVSGGTSLEQGRSDAAHALIRRTLDLVSKGWTHDGYVRARKQLTATLDSMDISAIYKSPLSARNSICTRVGVVLNDGTYTAEEIAKVEAAGYADESQRPDLRKERTDAKKAARAAAQAAHDAHIAALDPQDAVACLARAAELIERAGTLTQQDAVAEQKEFGRAAVALKTFKQNRATTAAVSA